MSLAESLINSLVEPQTDEDNKTLVIDHYTRSIIIPKGITSLGVENDDDVLRLNFKMPRYLGAVDLYNFNIRINYINAQGKDDIYDVTDKAVVGDYIIFSWLVGPIATAYRGNTRFNVAMVITNSDSTVQQAYNTTVASLPVRQGLECSKRAISKYSDILAQWESRLFGFGKTEEAKLASVSEQQQNAIADKGAEVLATIPREYTDTVKMAEEGARTKADAIICSAEGEAITVHDSSDDHLRGLKIFGKTTQVKTTGKNLFDISKIASNSRITNNNGTITISTPEGSSAVDTMTKLGAAAPGLEVGKSYILSFDTTGTSDYIYLEEAKYMISRGKANTFTQEMLDSDILLYASGVSTSATLTNFMIRDASITDASYEPYSGGVASPSPEWPQEMVNAGSDGSINVTVYGKNLITYPYQDASGTTNNGITYTVNSDGSITVNGTATANSSFAMMPSGAVIHLPVGWVYTSLGNGYGNGIVQIQNDIFKDDVYVATLTNSLENASKRLLTQPHEIRGVRLKVVAGVKVNNVTVYPMLCVAEPISGYEPYREKRSYTVQTETGLPGIPVTSGGNYIDSEGQQWISDEIDLERKVYVQHFKTVAFTGQENWVQDSNYNCAYRVGAGHIAIAGLCTHYPTYFTTEDIGSVDGVYVAYTVNHIITDTRFVNDLNGFKAFLAKEYADGHPVTVLRQLNAPIETPLTADEIAAFKELKSNYPNTTVINDGGAGMLLRYNADTETWITNLIDEKIAAAVAKL